VLLTEVQASPALESTAMLYRLSYANAQQLRPYALARWSMTPAQLLRQRLREQLSEQRSVLQPGEISPPVAGKPASAAGPLTLRIELEEFSQLFEAPEQSVGLLRLRATLIRISPSGEKEVAQRSVIVQRPASSADAPGGVRALSEATDAAVQELSAWLAAF
jgi:cholesterol transport system auxiliary component